MISYRSLSTATLKDDIIAGSVVFLIAIPLCLGIALASGAPLFSGIIAGIIGGIVVGTASQSHISVSGPAAGLAAIVLAGIHELGGFNAFLLALTISGLLQIIIGYCRAGFIADYIPSNVLQGLLCAIGLLIILKQLPFAITYSHFNDEILSHLVSASSSFSLKPLLAIQHHINYGAVSISIISLSLLIYLEQTKRQFLKTIPSPVVVIILSVAINELFDTFYPALSQDSADLVNIPSSTSFQELLGHLTFPDWSSWTNPDVYLFAVILAVVSSLVSLLNLEGAEKLAQERRHCSRNRELVAQGIGNLFSGLIGGLPVTSVIIRSSVNIHSGAKSKLSAITHGFLILFTVIHLEQWLNKIPLAALAGILIHVGYKLSKPAIYHEMYRQGWSRFLPFMITVSCIITFDLLTGIIIGLLTAIFFILKENSQLKLKAITEKHPSGNIKRIILPEQLSFLCKAALSRKLKSVPARSKLVLDARHTHYIDRDILETINTYLKYTAKEKHITVNALGFKDDYEIHNYVQFTPVTTEYVQTALTPEDVVNILKEGNQRFLNNNTIHRHLPDEIKAVSNDQHPMAIILGCIDSRVPVETIFDMGLGDVFVSRVAGNVINDDIIASLEFACCHAGAKVIMVLGHLHCGAVNAACNMQASGPLGELLAKIKPAIAKAKTTLSADDPAFTHAVTHANVENSIKTIYKTSPVLQELVDNEAIGLIGAVYNVKTGEVTFHDAFYTTEVFTKPGTSKELSPSMLPA